MQICETVKKQVSYILELIRCLKISVGEER